MAHKVEKEIVDQYRRLDDCHLAMRLSAAISDKNRKTKKIKTPEYYSSGKMQEVTPMQEIEVCNQVLFERSILGREKAERKPK